MKQVKTSSTLSGGWQVWSDTGFAAYLGPRSLPRPTANGVDVSGKPLFSCSPLEKGFTVEAAKLVLANAKPPAKGFQPLLAGWVHEKVKNYSSRMHIPNPVTHCFTEQEAKQLALMTECKERKKKKKRFSWERSSEGNFITRS